MGALTSTISAEAYIGNMEHGLIYPILIKHQIIGCFK
jgi:hypothetical protein